VGIDGCARTEEFLGDDISFDRRSSEAAIPSRNRHPDPSSLAELFRKLRGVSSVHAKAGPIRAGGKLSTQKLSDFTSK
jgi:hypothetical protein